MQDTAAVVHVIKYMKENTEMNKKSTINT